LCGVAIYWLDLTWIVAKNGRRVGRLNSLLRADAIPPWSRQQNESSTSAHSEARPLFSPRRTGERARVSSALFEEPMVQRKGFAARALLLTAALFATGSTACLGDREQADEANETEGEAEDVSQDVAPEDHAQHDHSSHDHSSALTVQQWTYCAREGQRCQFTGQRQVRYNHAERGSATRTLTGGTQCVNTLFWTVPYDVDNYCEVLLDVEVGTAGMDMNLMPYVDKSKLPIANEGVGVREIRWTSERPAPYEIGAFRTSCQFSHMNFDDPIVFPGQPGKAHLHAYFGNTQVNAYTTTDSIHTTGNSTCRGGIVNRSAYWVPAVLDPSGAPVKPHSAQIYYKTGYEGVRPGSVRVFPRGLRMIAGDAKSKGPEQERAYWSCETYGGHPRAIPDCQAGDRVVMMVQFPQCWNGVDLDSADHKSHMSYPASGGCPATHPVAIPEITFNIYYDVPPGTRSSDWRLSSDMYDPSLPGGYSAHGDWFEGWDRMVAATFVKYCDQGSNDCHSHLLGDGRALFSSIEPPE
jgi:Domain of unknown function (DUF1996)